MVKNPPSNVGDAGLIPARGTKIPHAAGQLSPRAPQLLSLRASVREPTCCKLQSPRALEPANHNYRVHVPWSRAPQLERENPHATTREKPVHHNEEPTTTTKKTLHASTKILCAATKTRRSQENKFLKKQQQKDTQERGSFCAGCCIWL